jgi:hypothetical protein
MAKYEKGRRCLVLNHTHDRSIIGHEVILGDRAQTGRVSDGRGGFEASGLFWRTDPPIFVPGHPNFQLVFREPWLFPIDDETINEELRNEVVDDPGTKRVELDTAFKKLDKALSDLEEHLKRRLAEKKQAI